MATQELLDDVLELAGLLKPAWAPISAGIHAAGVPTCEGDDDDADTGDDDRSDDDGDRDDREPAKRPDGDPAAELAKMRDELRKHRGTERRAKTAEQRVKELEERLSGIEAESLSEHEKALAQARKEAAEETAARYETERRAERLELAVTRHATRGVTLDDTTVKFADPDDALAHLDRAIRRGDVDPDGIYDDQGRVQDDALQQALADLLRARPHLAATNGNGDHGDDGHLRVPDADAGRGRSKDTSAPSVQDDLKHIQSRTVRP